MNAQDELLDASCRVALAACLHDLGKFAERAALTEDRQRVELHEQSYCRRHEAGGKKWYSHKHAAWTALAWERVESYFPALLGDAAAVAPFAAWGARDVDDSMVNAAARHHRPETALQWIVATADRVASGFEREEFASYNEESAKSAQGHDHFTTRLLTLFENIRLEQNNKGKDDAHFHWRYPLRPLSVAALFPQPAAACESHDRAAAQREYAALWQEFLAALERIPASHRTQWPLWLDHFDSAWATYTQAIPAATWRVKAEVSLYDHSHTTAALATALWRYHYERGDDFTQLAKTLGTYDRPDWGVEKFLLIQGDFFGIQEFIFATGGETQRHAARLLRGRSFQVSLLSECAALKILEALALPSFSQVINAAGKFLIVAPNTEQTRLRLEQVRGELDRWCLTHTFGQVGIGLAALPASCNDFLGSEKGKNTPFQKLITRLFDQLQQSKAQRFGLCGKQPPGAIFEDFLDRFHAAQGVCAIDGRSPAVAALGSGAGYASALALDQIQIGKQLAHRQRLLLTREPLPGAQQQGLRLDLFGYHVYFTDDEEVSGRFGAQAQQGNLRRAWDFGLPEEAEEALFRGYARRFINGYVPTFGEQDPFSLERYQGIEAEETLRYDPREPKSLSHIAHDDLLLRADGRWCGVRALGVLKGDVDNLGSIFESGLRRPTFAKMAALSRQIHQFFAVWLPWQCARESRFSSTYTVFAGGDDFFLIGPWRSSLLLAAQMEHEFCRYVAENPEIHFSAGVATVKPKLPIRNMGELGEEALEAAKHYPGKNAFSAFGHTVAWSAFHALLEHAKGLDQLAEEFALSSGYIYDLQHFAAMAEDLARPQPQMVSALWPSRFAYRTWRMLGRVRGITWEERVRRHQQLVTAISNPLWNYQGAYCIALFIHLYQKRS